MTSRAAELPIQDRVAQLGELFASGELPDAQIFAPSLLGQLSPARLRALIGELRARYGTLVDVSTLRYEQQGVAAFTITLGRGYALPGRVGVENQAPHRIASLWFGLPVRLAASIEDLLIELSALPGDVSFAVTRLEAGGPQPVTALNPDRVLAIGSAFKLYVLAALVDAIEAGDLRWSHVVELDSGAISLPSGVFQNFEPGAPATLHTLAALMIALSDNTAADQLIRTLGRDRVESTLRSTGHAQSERNIPFLSTREWFLLRGREDQELIRRFLRVSTTERRELLRSLTTADLRSVDPTSLHQPSANPEMEWFASAADLVRVMAWLWAHTEGGEAARARKILTINPGLSLSPKQWSFVGFKGGSEPGVLCSCLLLRATLGTWFAVAAIWNDAGANASCDPERLLPLVERALQLISPHSAPSQ